MHETNVVIRGTGVVAEYEMDLGELHPQGIVRGCDDDALKAQIGKRGIRYKDRATRLALSAAKLAMLQAGLVVDGYQDLNDPAFAVIVASSFGNVDTLLRCVDQIAEANTDVLSPMDLPNASANVIAATLAIWFGLRGPNLLVANGARSGEDALLFASNMLRTGVVERVLVCGTEVAQPTLDRLFAHAGKPEQTPINVSAAVVLDRSSSAEISLVCNPSQISLHSSSGASINAADSPLSATPGLLRAYGAAGILAVISAQQALYDAQVRNTEAA